MLHQPSIVASPAPTAFAVTPYRLNARVLTPHYRHRALPDLISSRSVPQTLTVRPQPLPLPWQCRGNRHRLDVSPSLHHDLPLSVLSVGNNVQQEAFLTPRSHVPLQPSAMNLEDTLRGKSCTECSTNRDHMWQHIRWPAN